MAAPARKPDTSIAVPQRAAGSASLQSAIEMLSGKLDQLVAGLAAIERAIIEGRPTAERGIDPGDAVPPGVAVQSPEPLTAQDEVVLQALEDLPGHAPRKPRSSKRRA